MNRLIKIDTNDLLTLGLELADTLAALEDPLHELADRHGRSLTFTEDHSDLLAELMEHFDLALVLLGGTSFDAHLS